MSQPAKQEKSKSSRTKSGLPPPAGGAGGAHGKSAAAGGGGGGGHSAPTSAGGGGGGSHGGGGLNADALAHDAAQAATQAGTTLLHFLEKVLAYAKADSGYTFALAGAALTVLALNLRKRI